MEPHDVIAKSPTLEEIATSTHRSHILMRYEDCKKQQGREERYTQPRRSTTSTRRYVLRARRSPWHRQTRVRASECQTRGVNGFVVRSE